LRCEKIDGLQVSGEFFLAVMDRNPAMAEFAQKIGLGQSGHLRGLTDRGFVGHEQAN
jgi:hypothetical protein